MTVKPPYMFQRTETVANLLELFSEDRITLEQLLDSFLTRVKWEYRGITGDLDWTGENTWAKVWEAYHVKRTLSAEQYLFLTSQYEERMKVGA